MRSAVTFVVALLLLLLALSAYVQIVLVGKLPLMRAPSPTLSAGACAISRGMAVVSTMAGQIFSGADVGGVGSGGAMAIPDLCGVEESIGQ
jgi:hypothetical protein